MPNSSKAFLCGLWMFLAKQMMIVSLAIAQTVMKEEPFISKQVQYVINYRLCDGVHWKKRKIRKQ